MEWSRVEWSGVEWSEWSGVEYANHNGSSAHDRRRAQRRLRAPQPLLEALERAVAMQITMAVARTTGGGPSGDSARRSPF